MEENGLLLAPVKRAAEMHDDPHVNKLGALAKSNYADKKGFRAPPLPVEVNGQPVVS